MAHYFRVHFPALPYGWADHEEFLTNEMWLETASFTSLPKYGTSQCLALQVALTLPPKVEVHTGMEELRGPSSLQARLGSGGQLLSVVSTGDFARKSTKNCCVKFLSFSLLPEPKLVYLGCSAKLQFQFKFCEDWLVQVHAEQENQEQGKAAAGGENRSHFRWI